MNNRQRRNVFIPLDIIREGNRNIWTISIRNNIKPVLSERRPNGRRDNLAWYMFQLSVRRSEPPFFDENWDTAINKVISFLALRRRLTNNIVKILVGLEIDGHVLYLRNQNAYTINQLRGVINNFVIPLVNDAIAGGVIPQHVRDIVSGDDGEFLEALINDRENINGLKVTISVYEYLDRNFFNHPLENFIANVWDAHLPSEIRRILRFPPYIQ